MQKMIAVFLVGTLAAGLFSCAKQEKEAPVKVITVQGVKIETAQALTVDELYETVGTLRSRATSIVSSRVAGNILAVHFREGDRVRAGQLLVEIDDREAASQLRKAEGFLREAREVLPELDRSIKAAEAGKAAAEAEKTLASTTFQRYQTLLERKSVSPQEYDQVRARLLARAAEAERAEEMIQSLHAKKEQARARIEQAKAEAAGVQLAVGYGRVLSPLNGLVIVRQAEVGALAAPGTPLLTLEDNTRYRLEAAVEESQLGRVRLGEPVRVRIDALGGKELAGKVVEISPSADSGSRSSIVKIDLPQQTDQISVLRSGAFGKAFFRTGSRQTLTLPSNSVVQRGQLQEIFTVEHGNIVRLRLIKTGKIFGDRIEVLSGLQAGEKVVTDGVEKVQDGVQVETAG